MCIRDRFKALYYEIGRVISRIDSKSSEYDKAKQIHDYICKNMDYGYPKGPFSAYYGFAVYDALITKMGVCSDYAEAYKALCTKAGLECVYVTGDANNGSGYGGHAWNIVKIDGNWYHVDCTWDDPTNKGGDYVRYTYFLVSDKTLSVNHRWDRRNVPVCSKDYL